MDSQFDLTNYLDRLFAAAIHKTHDSYVAQELVQETALAALRSIRRHGTPAHPWAWLERILSNKTCDWLREKYGRPTVSFEDYPFELAAPDHQLESEEAADLERIRGALGYLASTHREVMARFYLHGETIEQIAEAMALPAGTVKSRL